VQQVNQFYKRRIKEQKQKESENGRVPQSEIVTPVENAELELNTSESEREKETHERNRKGLTPEEMEQVISNADSFKKQLVLKCLGGLGCRPSDLQGIRLQDVDLENNRVKIRSTKTTNSREVPISDSLREYLNLWINHGYRDSCYYADSTDWLIPGERSEQVGSRTINKIVYEVAGESPLQETLYTSSDGREHKRITAYSFRIGFATYMKDKVSPKELQYLMGHQKIETTLRHYTEVTDEDIDRMQPKVPDI
jgi:integrase